MPSELETAFAKRRSYYDLSGASPISDQEIEKIVDFAALHTPSAFNSQSARMVLLFGGNHKKLWEIVRDALRKIIPPESFEPTGKKIDSFAAGHGTVLFYEDQAAVADMQKSFPLYKDAFPTYSMHSSGMIQYVVWVLLRDAGLGASLQHYGNLIETEVAKTWKLPASWQLIAQMPFGAPNSEPEPKDKKPLSETVRVFA